MSDHKGPKAMTLRLDPDKAALLEAIARTEDRSLSDAVRDAIAEYIATRSPRWA
jgi:predicted transcriptional regulator